MFLSDNSLNATDTAAPAGTSVRKKRAVGNDTVTTEAPTVGSASNTSSNAEEKEKEKTPWCLENDDVSFKLYMNAGPEIPTPEAYEYMCTLPLTIEEVKAVIKRYPKKDEKWKVSDFDRCTCFIRQDQMNL